MADKLYSGLAPRPAVLVTDILAFLPLAGPPAEQADITALFSDASSVLSIDRDNRLLIAADGTLVLDWDNCRTFDRTAGTLSSDWNTRTLIDPSAALSLNWDQRIAFDSAVGDSIRWNDRTLHKADGSIVVNWETGVGIIDSDSIDQASRRLMDSTVSDSVDWENRLLIDSGGINSVDWENRLLLNSAGGTFLDFSTGVFTGTAQMLHGAGPPTNGPATPAPNVLTDPAIYYDSDSGSGSYGTMWPWDPAAGTWIGA